MAGNTQPHLHMLHKRYNYGSTSFGLAQELQPSGEPYNTTSQFPCSCYHSMYAWLLEQPCKTVRKELWYAVCLAALTAMLRARDVMFNTLARTGLEPALVETRAVDLLLAALSLKDFAACQGSVSSFSDLGQVHPFVYARPNGSLAVSLQLPP